MRKSEGSLQYSLLVGWRKKFRRSEQISLEDDGFGDVEEDMGREGAGRGQEGR